MTGAAESGKQANKEEVQTWEVEARALAAMQRAVERPKLWPAPFFAPARVASALERAHERLVSSGPADAAPGRPAEWFLDNYYLIRRAARQVAQELPRGFLQHLPRLLHGPAKGVPRVYLLANELVARTGIAFDAALLKRFLLAYQEVSPLTIAELWALPTILRASALNRLLQFLAELGVVTADVSHAIFGSLAVDAATGVERTIRTLRLLAEIDWQAFFEETSRVEATLREDPAKIYARMDFATCDAYRKSVEELAWATILPEEDVAASAVALASEAAADERCGHVGYYLIGAGRRVLEERLGYRAQGIERVRRMVRRRPTLSYLVPLALVTASLLALSGWYAVASGAGLLTGLAVLLLAFEPASVTALTAVQWVLTRLLPPDILPKLDFSRGLPEDVRCLVVVPTLLGRPEDAAAMARRLELHYLSNPDPRLAFALLTDEVDAKAQASNGNLADSAAAAIASLNAKHGSDGTGPFHLLHREPRWNPSEGCFMGWERKRGKLEELNRLLRGAQNGSYARHEGDPKGLERIRFVITLDSDTELPIGSAHRLIGILAHPLNRAVFDPETGRVTAGYTIVQPRMETSPTSSQRTRFFRIFAGDVGFDIYTHAASDLYQDLFGSGIYVGKGIYDVDSFTRSLEGRVPENALLSHDLFEGIHGRAALASDVVLFEDYPAHYAAYARRMHRWICGDWQLLPWLSPKTPSARGRVPNRLALIDRWKIADNLRRSLTAPLLVLLLVSGWTWLPGHPLVWTLAALSVLFVPLVPGMVQGGRRLQDLARSLLGLVFAPYEAAIAVDAVVRTCVRMAITRMHLLRWTSAAHTAQRLSERARGFLWREMIASPLLAVLTGTLVCWVRPWLLLPILPILAAWLVAPEIARFMSLAPAHHERALNAADERRLRRLARRTWLFFETFVGPGDQWLPVDNYQESPHEQTAHRTSPTNIGMMLLSALSAYDLGYLGAGELLLRIRSTFESIGRLEHYRGHLLNWYDTKNLQPLLPRYVSTVDSGNLAGCLVALEQGCKAIARVPVSRGAAWDGLSDALELLAEVLAATEKGSSEALISVVAEVRRAIEQRGTTEREAYATLRTLCEETAPELDRQLLLLLDAGAYQHDAEALQALRTWVDRFHHQLHEMRREMDTLLPWLALAAEPAAEGLTLPGELGLDEIPRACRELGDALDAWERRKRETFGLSSELEASAGRLREAFRTAGASAEALHAGLLEVALRAGVEAAGMDFRLLYDRERKLFRIGYNVTLDALDAHHYDLLASEARLASYLAIVQHEVPEAHWYVLGRPMTHVAGAPALLSWGGTMFEYLMPSLLMRTGEGTLLGQSCELAVEAQILHGKERKTPWGVSESAFGRQDAHQTYQYRSFGVPGLGFRRHLADDKVIAPYAAMLAMSLRPRAVVDNLVELESMGALGTYGLCEAIDFDPEHLPSGRSFTLVRSYMAHHQGMLLVALDNYLRNSIMVRRFHSAPSVEIGELLLNERMPGAVPAEWPAVEDGDAQGAVTARQPSRAPSWLPRVPARPEAFVLSNGRLTTWLTDSGGGGLRWHGLALTSFRPDPTCEAESSRIYVRDEQSGRVWRATSADGRTTFDAHKVEFHLRDQGLSVHVDVTVAAADDVEVRQITLHNETDRPRQLVVVTAFEPVLLPVERATGHPAFARLFVESDFVPELDALVFARRQRSAEDQRATLVHRLVCEGPRVTLAGYETDRGAFFGRHGTLREPKSLAVQEGRAHDGALGAVLDPLMSLRAKVELRPQGSVTFAFVTAVDRSRGAALELARRYGSMHAVRWAFRDAEQESLRRLERAGLPPTLLPTVQRLLSALVFIDSSLRAGPDVIAAGRPEKRRLWGRGISGDFPILLVRVHDAQAALLSETLVAHRYLRACGVRIDLVLVDQQASGYLTEGVGTLRSVLARHEVDDWLNRRGGIYVVARDQLSGEEECHLEASARVVLDTRDSSLVSRIARPVESVPHLPPFEPTLAEERAPAHRPRRPTLLFDNGIGGFTEDGRDYVISVQFGKPTPAPWCNVLANPSFGCLTSESSLGYTWSENSGENRLTPWRNDPVFDTPSESVYLRDEETGAVWSPTPLPAGLDVETIVRHGAGYTRYQRESHAFEQELTVFVPPDAPLKIVRLRLKNTLPRRRRVTATYYAEWVLGSMPEEQRPYVASEIDRPNGCLLATCHWNTVFAGRVAFLASELRVHGFTTDRTEFLGGHGDPARPAALERWGLTGRTDAGIDPCAALQVHLELGPGEEVETHFVLGQAATRDEALRQAIHFRSRASVDAAWDALTRFWDGLTGSLRVKTPEPSMDLMLNRWLLYQTVSSRLFGRTGFYQSSGAFGFRDQLQDVLALLRAARERARAQILEAAAHQFEQGDVLHWWHPPSGSGVRSRCSDDLVWLAYVTAEYVEATGDASILSQRVPFLTGEPLRRDEHDRYAEFATSSDASLFEHCRRALERGLTHGRHGLPLMGDGDWNDGMNRVGSAGHGESVWLGFFLYATIERFASLCERLGEHDEATTWRGRNETLRASLDASAWDGAWFLRAFHDDGSRLGAASNRECRIDSIAQSWSVLSGAADAGRASQALAAADQQLVREDDRLVLLLWPPFANTQHDPGYIRAYPRGVRENGGQYTHAAAWLGWAHAALGEGERAERIFRLINPILRASTPEQIARYRVEPYVLAGDIYSCPPWVARGGWTWYTGAAAWTYRLGVEAILGLRMEEGQLRIDPCIPSTWKGFDAWLRVGALEVHVVVDNPDAVSAGVVAASLDGAPLPAGRLPLDPNREGTHEVYVRLGASVRQQAV